MIEQIAELQGTTAHTFDLPFSNSRLEGAAAALVTEQDRELLIPLMAGLDADLVVEDNALTEVFGITPTPFAVAAGAALGDVAVP